MALVPVVVYRDGSVVLSLDVDATRTVVGWQVDNRLSTSIAVRVETAASSMRRTFAPGITSGSFPRGHQWTLDDDSSTARYEVTVRG